VSIKVRVRNFQSVEDAEISIDGLTVVTGTNNAGKSAFFRAIRGALMNARGYDFVRHGQDHCVVDLTFDDDRTLTWKKGKNVNTYIVNGEELKKVGHGVPPEVRIFGMDPVIVGNKTELWPQIAPQITGVSFLLHETGSVIAEAVADVRRVNQLSRALSACEKDRKAARSQLKVRRGDTKALKEKAERFIGLDAVEEEIEALEGRRREAQKVAKAVVNVDKLQRRHKDARKAVRALEGVEEAHAALPAWERVEKAQEVAEALFVGQSLKQRRERARGLVQALDGVDDVSRALPSEDRVLYAQQFRKGVQLTVELAMKVEAAQKEIATADSAQAALASIDFGDELVDRAAKYKKALSNAVGLKSRYLKNQSAVDELEQQIREQEQQFQTLNSALTGILGDVEECPTCGGGLDHVH